MSEDREEELEAERSKSWVEYIWNTVRRLFYVPLDGLLPCNPPCLPDDEQFKRQSKMKYSKDISIERDPELQLEILDLQLNNMFVAELEKCKSMSQPFWQVNKKERKLLTPGWNPRVMDYLDRLYDTLVQTSPNRRITPALFLAACTRVGGRVDGKEARRRFWETDADKDGFLSRDEFFWLLYTFDQPKKQWGLGGLAKCCIEAANRESYIRSLGRQRRVMYGLA